MRLRSGLPAPQFTGRRGCAPLSALATSRRAGENEACYAKSMTWARKFAKPIVLNDGRAIATLGEGRDMVLSLPSIQRREPIWRCAAELLNEAAADKNSVPNAEAQLTRALTAGGLISGLS